MKPFPPIPDYELLRPLGGGPLSCVYTGLCLESDTEVAVKLLRDTPESDPIGLTLLRREALAGLCVQHPHLVQLLDARVTKPPYFLVMKLLPGESLRERLKREYCLEPRTALWVTRQTAEALAAMHRAGFIHGDVKPDNIRLVDAGTAVLVDLGFAHRPGENNRFWDEGYVLGTANYLAPELCGDQFHDDLAADVFSLGVTLFEMLTGELPYPSGSVLDVMRMHHDLAPADLRDYDGDWPTALAGLVARMLDHRPERRPRASRVVQDLVSLEIAALRPRLSA